MKRYKATIIIAIDAEDEIDAKKKVKGIIESGNYYKNGKFHQIQLSKDPIVEELPF